VLLPIQALLTYVTGNVGSNIGAATGFGNVNGVMHSGNSTTAQCATDINIAYNQLNATIPNFFVAPLIGNGDTLTPGVYQINGVTTLSGNLILNGQGDPNAVFIFKIQAAFSTTSATKVILINGALACNVFWKIEGLVDISTGTYMRGTIIANNAGINMNSLDTLEGRAFSTTGAIALNGTMVSKPVGCGSPVLSGPIMPPLGSTSTYALFTSNGEMTNAGISNVVGDVGTNVGLTTGFNPLLVIGMIHPMPDGSTAAAAADLLNASSLMNIMPYDIELLYPAQFGNDLVLTPNTYILIGATALTGNIVLNAQGNPNAIFFIKIYGALATSVGSNVILTNGAQSDNVFWLVSGAVSIGSNSQFNGNLISINGAISTFSNVTLNGRLLTTNGAFSTVSISATSNQPFVLTSYWNYFEGKTKQQNIELNWDIQQGLINQTFLIEKSQDGISFETLNTMIVESGKNDYTYIDYEPHTINYYRISQTDIEGHSDRYKTIQVNMEKDGIIVNHSAFGNNIEIRMSNTTSGFGTIELFTIDGKLVSTNKIIIDSRSKHYTINKPFQNGLYFLRILADSEVVHLGKILIN
jgi:hypothetical protein